MRIDKPFVGENLSNVVGEKKTQQTKQPLTSPLPESPGIAGLKDMVQPGGVNPLDRFFWTESFNTPLDKQMDDSEFPWPNTVEEYDIDIAALERIRREIVTTGHSGSLGRETLPRIDELLEELEAGRKATQILMDTSQVEIVRERGRNRQVVPSGGPVNSPENDVPSRARRLRPGQGRERSGSPIPEGAPSLDQAARGRGRSRRPHSGGNASPSNSPGEGSRSGSSSRSGGREHDSRVSGDRQKTTAEKQSSSHWGGAIGGGYSQQSSPTMKLYNSSSSDETSEPSTSGTQTKEKEKPPELNESDPYSNELPADDSMSGKGGNDIGARGKISQLPRGVTRQDADLVGPAVSTKTGAQDEEQLDLGQSPGSTSASPYGGDLGDDLPYDLSEGGTIDRKIGQELMNQLRRINPGGPDPEK